MARGARVGGDPKAAFLARMKNFVPEAKGAKHQYFLPDEEYVVRIERIDLTAHKGAFVIEGRVVEGPAEQVGKVCVHIIKNNEFQPQNVSEFICAAYGGSPRITAQMEMFGDEERAACLESDWSQLGKLVRLTTRGKATEKGGQFTAHYWAPHETTTAEFEAALRAIKAGTAA
jgi:hypothetical protein